MIPHRVYLCESWLIGFGYRYLLSLCRLSLLQSPYLFSLFGSQMYCHVLVSRQLVSARSSLSLSLNSLLQRFLAFKAQA
jgi:hypothetical protein